MDKILNKSMRISEKSYKKLVQMCKDEKQRIKDIGYEPMDTELVEDDMNKFKDNHGFSLYCDRCKIYRLPRAHHCSTCGQ